MLEVGGGLRIVSAEKSLIFDEQMLEPGMKFPSSRLEAVYAVPFEDSQVSVILTNTTAQPIVVDGDAIFDGANGHHPIQGALGPYQTQVVSLPHGLVKKASAGAVSLNHNGGKGALLAIIHLQGADRGYSETVNFANPSGKTTERHGAGLRLGSVNNDLLRPVIAVRNIGDSATTVTATVPYSKQSGDTGTIALPQVSLAPGEIKLLDTSNPQLRRKDFATAGLEIKYAGAPGSVIASASSVSRSGNHVFTLPMKDPQGGLSSTGGYPWFISGSSSTVVFIKNTTNEPRTFTINLVYAGGQWGSGLKTIAPGQTFKLDVREVRDSQIKGSEGNALPLDAVSGHVNWSVRGKQSNKTLIGRAQMVDFSNGLTSTYECQLCCPRSFYDSRLVPGGMSGYPGYQEQFLAQERTRDCFGNVWPWDGASGGVVFDSDDWNVATISFGGLCTAMAPGSTTIRASWNSVTYFKDINGDCFEEQVPTEPTADCNVQEPQPHHVKVITDQFGFPAGCTNTPVYLRQIKVQIVSEGGVAITHTDIPISETFPTQPNNTCGNGNPAESACSTQNVVSGVFIDTMSVHAGVPFGSFCNTGINQSSGCGYTLTSLWAVCPGPSFGGVNLWMYNGETRSNMVRVNGQATAYPPGHEFFP